MQGMTVWREEYQPDAGNAGPQAGIISIFDAARSVRSTRTYIIFLMSQFAGSMIHDMRPVLQSGMLQLQ